jgi:hypothetical protein
MHPFTRGSTAVLPSPIAGDLQAAVERAARYKLAILPRGAVTSLAGQAIDDALILDCFRFLDSILDIDPRTKTTAVVDSARKNGLPVRKYCGRITPIWTKLDEDCIYSSLQETDNPLFAAYTLKSNIRYLRLPLRKANQVV